MGSLHPFNHNPNPQDMRNSRRFRLLTFAVASLAAVASAPVSIYAQGGVTAASVQPTADEYEIDIVHSELSFRIRHLLGRVAGTFGEWGGTVTIDTLNPANSSVNVVVQTASIDTRVPPRDEHLRTSDFFAVDSFPTMTFRSRNVVVQGNQVRVLGDLTLRGVTKPVLLTGTYEGMFTDPWGGTRTAFIASTTINRHDFGVSFDGPFMEIGQIGDEVYIEIAIEAVKK